MSWLRSLQGTVAGWTAGHGLALAVVVFCAVSALVAIGVWTPFRTAALTLGIVVSIIYWLLGQSLGGLTTTQATDPNAGLHFVLLALAHLPRPRERVSSGEREPAAPYVLTHPAPPAQA